MTETKNFSPPLILRSIRIEGRGGSDPFETDFDPRFVRLEGKEGAAVAAALGVLFGAGGFSCAGIDRIGAVLDVRGQTVRIEAERRGETEDFSLSLTPSVTGCIPSLLPCREECALSFFHPQKNGSLADRLRRYRDPESFFGKNEFCRLTGGVGNTPSFRAFLRGYIDRFLPGGPAAVLLPDGRFVPEGGGRLEGTEKERFELDCFLSLNAFWREVEEVRDLNFAPLPLVIFASGEALAPYRKKIASLERQVFFRKKDNGILKQNRMERMERK